MRFRFQSRRHLTLDVGTGDILAEKGDVLITGRISARSPLSSLVCRRPCEEMQKLLLKPTLRFHCDGGAWPNLFSIQWTARSRSTQHSSSYNGALLAVQQIVHHLSTGGLLTGNVRVGMTPFSWRAPALTAQLMHDCLCHLFFAVRDHPRGNVSLHVLIRSPTEFRGLTELLTRDLPVRRGPFGLPLTPWVPDDS